jgi:hypothetical protein
MGSYANWRSLAGLALSGLLLWGFTILGNRWGEQQSEAGPMQEFRNHQEQLRKGPCQDVQASLVSNSCRPDQQVVPIGTTPWCQCRKTP